MCRLSIAAAEGNGVMILGAFGCGALCNPPEIVAEAMRTIVQEYRSHFQAIKCGGILPAALCASGFLVLPFLCRKDKGGFHYRRKPAR